MAKHTTRSRRGWIIPSAVASAALITALGMNTLGAYTATITNDGNTAGAGSLTMSETGPNADGVSQTYDTADGTNNAIAATNINKYGGDSDMAPGESKTTTVTFENTGTVDASDFQLTIGEATVTPSPTSTSLADELNIKLEAATDGGNVELFNGTATEFAARGTISLTDYAMAVGETQDFIFTVTLPEDVDYTVMDQDLAQTLTWNLSTASA